MECNHARAVVCCIIAVGFLGFQTCGSVISHLDVASNYAGNLHTHIKSIIRPINFIQENFHTTTLR